jgi:hypothetical protein
MRPSARAVRRGIAENNGGEMTLVARTIDGYDRGFSQAAPPGCDHRFLVRPG